MASELRETLALGRLRLRIRLHTGEALQTAEDYAGLDVHRAARICAAAHGGPVLLSQAARDLVGSGHGFKHGPPLAERLPAAFAGEPLPERFGLGDRVARRSMRAAGSGLAT
jgi:class 3 adenylate cyclase